MRIGLGVATLAVLAGGLVWSVLAGGEPGSTARASDTQEQPAKKRAHPLYPDGETLDWSTKLAEAQQLAKGRRKLIFIEYGRES